MDEKIKFLGSRVIYTWKIKRMLLLIIAVFISMLVFGNNESYGATQTATTTYSLGTYKDYEIEWEYELDTNGNATNVRINSAKLNGNDTAKNLTIKIPAEIEGAPVVSIGDGLQRVIASTQESEQYDFRIFSVEIPDSVLEINDYAFEGCIKLRETIWSNNIKRIGNYAFYKTACRNFRINNVTRVIPENVEEIGDYAFAYNNDNYIVLGNTHSIWFSHGVLPYDTTNENADTTLIIGDRVRKIGNNAFENQNIKKLKIPSTVESVGNEAFKNNTYLTSVIIEDRASEMQMGEEVFEGCTSLTSATIESQRTTIPNRTFKNCKNLQAVNVATNNVSKLGDEAFSGCKGLATDDYNSIVEKVTEIGNNAFANTNLTGQVEVKSVVTSLGEGVFKNSKIESALIHENITKLPAYLFENCKNLTSVTKANTVTEIGQAVFKDCDAITLEVLHSQILPNIVSIGESAFEDCNGLEGTLVIPSNVETIGDYGFYSCTKIKDIEFNEGIKNIGKNAFYNIDIPQIKNFPSTIETIGSKAFYQVREVFFEGNLPNLSPGWYGRKDALVHYNNHTHRIDVTCTLPGVKIVNLDDNNSNFISGDYACKSTYNLKVVVDDEYKNSYPDLSVKIISVGEYESSDLIKKYIDLNDENEFTVGNYIEGRETEGLIRDLKIVVQKSRNETDLVLRKYITKINGQDILESRKPTEDTTRSMNNMNPILYKHTKYPVTVEKNDKVTYAIRVYNEGDVAGEAKEIKVYLQDGLELDNNSTINAENGWRVAETTEAGVILVTDSLKEEEIPAYRGEGKPEYKEIELECRVVKDNSKRLVSVAELSDSTDADSAPGTITLAGLNDYKIDESYSSTYNSFVELEQDSMDYENVELKNFIKVGYTIAIQKIDAISNELLNGAKFTLYDENENVIEENVEVRNGTLEFSEMISYGEGIDTYYIEEAETPAGYQKTIDGKMLLTVEKVVDETGKISLKIICEVNEEVDVNESQEFIPIETAEQLAKIGSNAEINVDGKSYIFAKDANYILKNDIELNGEWTPIKEFSGIFNGDGKTISNLTITGNIPSSEDICKCGLFETVGGIIRNLNLENCNINIESDNVNNCYVGAIAGYMVEGKIENCSVSGAVSANTENIGGFIGHTAPEKFIKIINSVNNANVTGSSNVGGMVGCAKGNIELINCTNKGTVTSQVDYGNAGGLVGVSDPNGTTAENIVVGYDDLNKRITIAVKNKRTTGNYDLVLEKINKKTNEYLDGGIFNIYDKELNIISGYEAIKAEKGILEIPDILINSLETDVFYIKEIEAPEGYDIAIKDYVKIAVTKKWNSETGKFEVDVLPSVTTGITETASNSEDQQIGMASDFVGSEYVIYKTDRIRASNCTNEGIVVSDADNGTSGGLVGLTVGNVDIYDSNNNGQVIGSKHVGGMVGLLGGYGEDRESKIIRCENGVLGSETPSVQVTKDSAYGAIGGIVGTAVSDATFSQCKNYSTITGLSEHTGGILGESFDRNLYVYDCENYGNISLEGGMGSSDIGGIIGVQYGYGEDRFVFETNVNGTDITNNQNVKTIIMNCKSLGNISINNASTGTQAGGIIGEVLDGMEGDSLYITNCTVGSQSEDEVMTILGGGAPACKCTGGLLGRGSYDEIVFRDNNVMNLKIGRDVSNNNGIGGLAGEISAIDGDKSAISNIEASGNNVENVEILAQIRADNTDIGGLFGMIFSSKNWVGSIGTISIINTNIDINNNTVKDSRLLSNIGRYSSIGGLVGLVNGEATVNVKGNQIIDTDIESVPVSGSSGMGGLIGELSVIEANIDSCEIKSTNSEHKYGIKQTKRSSEHTEPVGGYIGAVEVGKVNISNSKLTSISVMSTDEGASSKLGYTAPAVGGLIGETKGDANIDNVELNDVIIDTIGQGTNAVRGGFIGLCGNVNVTNSKFTNSTMDIQAGSSIGGILGHRNGAEASIKGIELSNLKILVKTNDNREAISSYMEPFGVGGIIGFDNSVNGSTIIDECKLEDISIGTDKSMAVSVGGLIGGTIAKKLDISNITVINESIDAKIEENYDYLQEQDDPNNPGEKIYIPKTAPISELNRTVAGLVGLTRSNTDISKVSIDGLEIQSNISHVGGLVAVATESLNINNSQVKNAMLEENDIAEGESETKRDLAYGGLVGVYAGDQFTNGIWKHSCVGTIENSVVENVEIKQKEKTSTVKHAGGLVGIAGKLEISNTNNTNTVTNLKITNEASEGTIGGLIAVIVDATDTTNVEKVSANIANIKIEGFKANGNYAIGGMIGTGIAKIRDSVVTNMKTLLQIDENTEEALPTGEMVVGGIAGVAVEGSELRDVTVNSETSEEDADGTIIISNYLAGGIAGINSGRIIDAIVDNITVKSNKILVETTDLDSEDGITDEEVDEADVQVLAENETVVKTVASVAVQYFEEAINTVIRQVTVIQGSVSEVIDNQ